MCPKARVSPRKNRVPDRRVPLRLPGRPLLQNLRARARGLLVGLLVCAVLLPLGACGMSVKPSGQVVTEISVGR